MNSKILLFFLFSAINILAQNNNSLVKCNTSEANKAYFKNHPEALEEYQNFNNRFLVNKGRGYKSSGDKVDYIIPVVFHVYGNDFNGKTVNDELIKQAMVELNKDFQGLNDDYNTVNDDFKDRRGKLNISFRLAKKDPSGSNITGIIYYAKKNGYGDPKYNEQIALDAWDNYKYMNIFIQEDLYDDGETNNSGVAWFPSTSMSDSKLARIVYNGSTLGTNTDKEFASTLTHEFGHWLSLHHTFEGGCSGTDNVDDTPQEDGNHDVNCSPGTNCDDVFVNYENYMGYNGAGGCYKMFTEGQIDRLVAGLEHPSRVTLWQESNILATGVKVSEAENVAPVLEIISPNQGDTFIENLDLTLETTVTDENGASDINRVEFYFDDVLINTINFAPFNNTFKNLSLGKHVVKAIAYDNGGLKSAAEIEINVEKKVSYPEIKWITTIDSYSENGTEFAKTEKVRRIEISAFNKDSEYTVLVKGPNNFEQSYDTKFGETTIIDNAEQGTWTIEIPEVKKTLTKNFD